MGVIRDFSKQQQDAILKQSQVFWDAATLNMAPFFDVVNEMERLTRVLLPIELESAYTAYNDRSSLVPPDIYNNISSMRGHIRSALFRKKPYFRLSIAGSPNIRDDRIGKAEQTVQQILDEEGEGRGFVVEADKAIYQALYAGLTCVLTTWARVFSRRVVRNENNQIVTKDGKPVYEEVMVAQYPETISIDIRRCRIDPSAAEKKDIRIAGIHSIQQQEDLIALNKNPETHYNFDEEKLHNSSFDKMKYFEYAKSESEMYPDKGDVNQGFGDKIVEVKSIRGLFRVPSKKLGGKDTVMDLIVEVGNNSVLLALKENDLPLHGWELFDWPAIDEQHDRMYSMGLVEPGRDQFVEMFIKMNQSLDAASRNTYVTYVGDSGATAMLPSLIESATDQILQVDLAASGLQSVGDALNILPRPVVGQDTFMHGQSLRRSLQQTQKLNDYTQGTDPGRAETATAVAELVSGGGKLTEHLMEKLADTFFKPVIKKKLILWNFFMADKEQTISRQDGTVLTIDAGEIDLPFHVAIDTTVGMSHPSMQRRMVEMFPMLATDPWFDPAVVRETLVDILELPNKDRLLLNRSLLKAEIDKESVALGRGVPQPVHPLENHPEHIRGHAEYLDFIQGQGQADAAAQSVSPEFIEKHIEEHQVELDKINASLGNSKDLGGAVGNQVQPDAARQNQPGQGATGNFTPSEGRR